MRARIDADLGLPGLPRERVLAAVVRLVDETLIRVGNDEYRRANGSFGATTIRQGHATVAGSRINIEFRGKGGKLLHAEVADRRLARTLQRLHDLPGQELFEYLDGERTRRRVRSRGRERLPARCCRRGTDSQGLPHMGRKRSLHAGTGHLGTACFRLGCRPLGRRRPCARWPARSATRPRSAERRTSIPRCSRPTRRASSRLPPGAACAASIAGSRPSCAS